MATGIPFPEANTILRAPTPEDAAAGTVYDLHVHRYTDLDGQPNVISKWQFTAEEIASVCANRGAFWLHCWGHTHPPIAIVSDSPFVRAGQRRPEDAHGDIVERLLGSQVGEVMDAAKEAAAEIARLRDECEALRADKARLDYLDRCNAALNAEYGTTYSWKLIQSHNVNRLMLGISYDVDLNDSQPHGLPSCREAIDERMRDAGRSAA